MVTRFCQAFDRGDVDAVMALVTGDCAFESTYPAPDGERLTGQSAVRKYWEHFFATTEDPRFQNEEMFASGDRVVSRWRFSWGSGETGGQFAASMRIECEAERPPRSSLTSKARLSPTFAGHRRRGF